MFELLLVAALFAFAGYCATEADRATAEVERLRGLARQLLGADTEEEPQP